MESARPTGFELWNCPGKRASSVAFTVIFIPAGSIFPHIALMIRPITPAAALAILGLFLASPLQGQTSAPAAGPSAAPHWAFEPLRNVTPPSVPGAKTPVDAFVLSRLQAEGLSLAPQADTQVLLRRAALVLTGLPPSPESLQAVARDPSPAGFLNAVEGLLASPAYGERWARHWLDAARFAESSGFEHDYDRPNAWPYRDYVIHAFNTDQPFLDFVRWQVAGDEIAPENPWALMATGFLGSGVFPTQITANEVERFRYDALDDMATTTGAAFLGLSVGCARCHDHKTDPIAAKDYYRLISTFATTVRSHMDLDLEPEENRQREQQWTADHARIESALAAFERDTLPRRFSDWLAAGAPVTASEWLTLDDARIESSEGTTLTPQSDGSVTATGKNPDFDRYRIVVRTPLHGIRALRVEALADPSLTRGGPGRADNGNFALSDLRLLQRPAGTTNEPTPVRFGTPTATFEQKGLPVAAAIDGDAKSGWAIDPEFGKDHAAVFPLEGSVGSAGDTELTLELRFDTNNRHSIGRLRVSVTTNAAPQLRGPGASARDLAAVEAAKATPARERTEAQWTALRTWHRRHDPEWQRHTATVEASKQSRPKPKLTTVMVATEGLTPVRMHTQGADFFEQTHFLRRGDPNLKGDVVGQGFLPVLMKRPETHWQTPRPEGARTSHRRRALAAWMTDPENGAGHLLVRVAVNRVWSLHFGQGIVATPNDFGRQGAPPTHPELLDWLAGEFLRNGGSIKALHRLLITSAVWQQDSRPGMNPTATRATGLDPEDRLLWHFPKHRLEAESIRDSLLAASGGLDTRMGGPGTLDEQQRRRSIYFMVKRSQLSPMLQLFDAPDAVLSVGNRPATITAPQALLFLNSPFLRARCEDLAALLAHEASSSLEQTVDVGYRRILGRAPTTEELQDSLEFLRLGLESRRDLPPETALRKTLADFGQVLFGLSEFLTIQ